MKKILILLALIVFVLGCIQSSADTQTKNTETKTNELNSKVNIQGNAKYVSFTQEEYNTARQEGKVILLEFYALWCPSCVAQEPIVQEAFTKIENKNVIGFRVNYNDSETNENEKELAKEFGISLQHTHVVLNSKGKVTKKAIGMWSEETIIEEINKALN